MCERVRPFFSLGSSSGGSGGGNFHFSFSHSLFCTKRSKTTWYTTTTYIRIAEDREKVKPVDSPPSFFLPSGREEEGREEEKKETLAPMNVPCRSPLVQPFLFCWFSVSEQANLIMAVLLVLVNQLIMNLFWSWFAPRNKHRRLLAIFDILIAQTLDKFRLLDVL